MAYVTDDIKPRRPSVLALRKDAPQDRCAAVGRNDSEKPDGVGEGRLACGDSPLGRGKVVATRAGDDDPRPQRPSAEALIRNAQRATEERKGGSREKGVPECGGNGRCDSGTGDLEAVRTRGPTVTKLIVYSCWSLVALWVLNVFYSVVRNVLVAQTRQESVLAMLLLLATVAVFAFISIYAWSLFASLPRIQSVCRAKYENRGFRLREKIRDEYLGELKSPGEYAMKAGVPSDSALAVKLKDLKTHHYADSAAFIRDFMEFQELQEKRAAEVVKKYAKLIAIKTAASPWRMVDMAAVFYNSTLMVCEISRIYNRRTSRPHAFRLILGWTVNLYVSGEIGQVAEETATALNNSLDEWLGDDGLGAMLQPALPLLSKFVGKAAEGGLNAYLAYRLGKRAIGAFRYLN